MLIVSDAAAAMKWYTSALGAGGLWDLGGVAGLDLGGAPFFVHEGVPGKNREPSPTAVGLTTTRIDVVSQGILHRHNPGKRSARDSTISPRHWSA